MDRRHHMAFDQARAAAKKRDQSLVVMLVEFGLGAVLRFPLTEPGNGHATIQFASHRRYRVVMGRPRESGDDRSISALMYYCIIIYRFSLIPAASRSHVCADRPRSRNLNFCTLPLSVRGSSSTNSTKRGIAK